MKALIWIGCIVIATILNTMLGYATGFKAGYLILYLVICFVAKNYVINGMNIKKQKIYRRFFE